MSERRQITTDQLKAKLELCREFGVSTYEETAEGFRFTLAPRAADRPALEPLSEEEAKARRLAEFRKVATMHTRGGR